MKNSLIVKKNTRTVNHWDLLSDRFNTHKERHRVHPDAAVNIYVGWPIFFWQIDLHATAQKLKPKDCKILDFGCGAGEFCKVLLKKGYPVTGMDKSKEMLLLAKENLHTDVNLLQGSHTSEVFDSPLYKGKYDVVTAIHSFEWIKDINLALKNLSKLLVPGGLLIFAVFPKDHIVDSLRIKDLFEDFNSPTHPKKGYANFDGIKVPVYVREPKHFDQTLAKLNFNKLLEYYPPYPPEFFTKYKWTGSKFPEMVILAYKKPL